MIITLGFSPVAEELIVDSLVSYFQKIKWKNMFPKFPLINISNEYPWVPYMDNTGGADLANAQETLFPSITVVSTQDESGPRDVNLQINSTSLKKEEYDDFILEVAKTGYMYDPAIATEIETYFEDNDELFGVQVINQRRETIHLDIITDDPSNVRNRIFDQVKLHLIGSDMISIFKNNGISIDIPTLSGSRTPEYNVEFGRVLRGSTLSFQCDINIMQTYYNTDTKMFKDAIISNISHVIGE